MAHSSTVSVGQDEDNLAPDKPGTDFSNTWDTGGADGYLGQTHRWHMRNRTWSETRGRLHDSSKYKRKRWDENGNARQTSPRCETDKCMLFFFRWVFFYHWLLKLCLLCTITFWNLIFVPFNFPCYIRMHLNLAAVAFSKFWCKYKPPKHDCS